MLDARLPRADEVDGDLIQAAQPMLLLGWSEPALLTARCALERAILEALSDFGLSDDIPTRRGLRDRLDRLEFAGVIRHRFRKDLVEVYSEASRTAHGEPTTLHEAVTMVRRIEWYCEKLGSMYPVEGGAPC